MAIKLSNSVNRVLTHEDFGKLLLRSAVGGLMLFHGLHKLFVGIDDISSMLIAKGLPDLIMYGVLLGEAVVLCLVIPGILMHPAALGLAFTMVVAWPMIGVGETWILDKTGVWAIESLIYFSIDVLAVAFLGTGRYSIAGNPAWWQLPSESQYRGGET